MAKFSIIDASTGEVKYSGTPRYNGTYCKVSYLEFAEICADVPIEWNVGDYVVYNRTGLTYKLYDIPQPKKRSYKYEYGGAFVYSNVQFYPDTKLLEIEPFRDLVPSDNEIHFTTQASWSVWTNAENLIRRFNAVMNTAYPNKWEFRLVTATAGSDLYKLLHDTWFDFTISGENVLQGLTKLYDLCGNIGWVHSVENGKNIITVGIPPVYVSGIGTATSLFRYGIGHGLTELRKSTTNRNELKTRLFAYGSTRNMIPRYYNNLTPAIKDAGSVYIPNLMLPLSEWGATDGRKDASKAYIDNNVALYGLRPETVYFDGSNGQKEIYPSLEETTIGELYDVMVSGATYRPNLTKHGRSVRLDEVEAVSGIVDDGQMSQGGEKYTYTQSVPIAGESGTFASDVELEVFTDVSCPVSGDVTFELQDLILAGQSHETLYNVNCKLLLLVGGKTYEASGELRQSGASISVKFSAYTVKGSAGDTMSATFVLSANGISSISPLDFYVGQGSINAKYVANKAGEFVVRIPQIGFDISTRARLGSQGLATISMKDGKCGGRSFVIKSVKYNSTYDSWELTLYRGLDESLDILFPNTTYPIASGDHFVLLDIAMPTTYIGMAEQKLLTAAQSLLNSISVLKPFYEPVVDAKFMVDNNRTLTEGQYMQLQDIDIIDGTEYVLIDTLVINEGESNIPTYKVTLREQKRVEYSASQAITTGNLTSLASGNNEVTPGLGTPTTDKYWRDIEATATTPNLAGSKMPVAILDGVLYAIQNAETEDDSLLKILEVVNIAEEGQPPVWALGTSLPFYSEQEITAGGIGEDVPVVSTTLGGLLNVADAADDVQSTDKILVRLANAIGANSWTLANLSDISGTVVGIRMNGTVKSPGTDKIIDLGTVLTDDSGNYLAATLKGAANGLAELGSDGKVPSSQLPSYVDDVLEYSSKFDFPATGESGKIYVALDTNLTYRWSGTAYVEISPSLALGETLSTAYRGDRGKIAYDHSQLSGNPHSTSLTDIVGATLAAKLAALAGWFDEDENGNIYVTKNGNTDRSFWAYGEITAGGVGSGGGGGGGLIQSVYGYTDLGGIYSDSDKTNTFNAYTTARLAQRITALENAPTGGVTSVINLTGNISQAQLRTALGLGSLAYLNGLLASDIPALDASKITSGTFADARIASASTWNAKQDAIADLSTIRTRANEGHTAYSWGNHANAGYLTLSAAANTYLPLSGGNITGNLTASGTLSASYLNIHPENTGVIIPAIFNDIAFINKRGGSLRLYSTTSTIFTALNLSNKVDINTWGQLEDIVDGTMGYIVCNASEVAGKTVVLDIDFGSERELYGTTAYIDFGSGDWAPDGVVNFYFLVDGSSTYASARSYIDDGILDHRIAKFNESTGVGVKAMRIVMKYSSSRTMDARIAAAGIIDFDSALATNSLMSRGKDEPVWRSIIPGTSGAYSLGSSSFLWGSIYASSVYVNGSAAITTGNIGSQSVANAGYSNTVLGSYTGIGGQQNPNYFGKNRVGFLMMNTAVNGNSNYKDWMIMDCYNSADVGGAVAFGVNRQSLGAYIMRSEAARTSWTQSAELYGTHNCNNTSTPWSCSNLTASNLILNGTISGATTINASLLLVTGSRISLGYSGGIYNHTEIWSDSNAFWIEARNVTDSGSGHVPMHFGWRGGVYSLTIAANECVGIGTTLPSEKLHVVGNIVATGEITAGASSDSRFKSNQQSLRRADAVLKALRPMEFDWNDLYHSLGGRNKGHDVGFIAQQVQHLIPSAIGNVYGDYLRLDYNKVTPYLVAGWQSHETRIQQLECENAELKKQLQQLN